jgi:hypothetical protein
MHPSIYNTQIEHRSKYPIFPTHSDPRIGAFEDYAEGSEVRGREGGREGMRREEGGREGGRRRGRERERERERELFFMMMVDHLAISTMLQVQAKKLCILTHLWSVLHCALDHGVKDHTC